MSIAKRSGEMIRRAKAAPRDVVCRACGIKRARHGIDGRSKHWFVAPRAVLSTQDEADLAIGRAVRMALSSARETSGALVISESDVRLLASLLEGVR